MPFASMKPFTSSTSFKRNPPKGIKTAHIDIDLIRKRLKAAAHDHAANTASK